MAEVGPTAPEGVTPLLPLPRLVLASRSPRRIELLREAGYRFISEPADIDEEAYPRELLPAEVAVWLARAKAAEVAARLPEDAILAADTVVALGDVPLGKPADATEAAQMLRLLSGTTHVVITGVALRVESRGIALQEREMSAVRMYTLTETQIARYVESGDWEGKAGGYGIQDKELWPSGKPAPAAFVERVAGSYTNVVGFPMNTVKRMLACLGIEPEAGA